MRPPLRTLLTGIVDYAGLFPPSKLPMSQAVENFAAYLAARESWMLARFVVPVARLEEFAAHAIPLLPKAVEGDDDDQPEPWRLSALIGEDLESDINAIFTFNQRHALPPDGEDDAGLAEIDTIELKANDPDDIDEAMDIIPEQLTPFFEIDHREDPRGMIAGLAGTDACAKIRCGGVRPDLIPTSHEIARFLLACAIADVPCKATAGLHHPIRAEHALTYEPDAPRAVMHGFLNVFLAGAIARTRNADLAALEALLDETDPSAIQIGDDSIRWNNHTVKIDALEASRAKGVLSFGSCSFTEPIEDLTALNHMTLS